MNTDEPIRSEIILHEDGNFYRRYVHETVIQNAAFALKESMTETNYTHSMIPSGIIKFSPNEPDMVHINKYYVSHNTKPQLRGDKSLFNFHVFVHLRDGFPMPEAVRIKNHEASAALETSVYNIQPKRSFNERNLTSEDIAEPVTAFYYNRDYHMFVCIKNISITNDAKSTLHPLGRDQHTAYLFGVHKKSGEVVTFNLPNIYDDGRICTGPDFVSDPSVRYDINTLNDYIEVLLKALYQAPFNNDLRGDDRHHLMVNDRGYSVTENHKLVAYANSANLSTEEAAKATGFTRFFKPITNELILDFAQCLIYTNS